MTLFDLAVKVVSEDMRDITDSDDLTFDAKYAQKVDALIRMMHGSALRLERLSFPFIEEAFRDINADDEVYNKLDAERVDVDKFPEGLLAALSEGIYEEKYNDLNKSKRLIIKLLSLYIIISI